MIEVAVGRSGELERSEADVVQGLVVDADSCIRAPQQIFNAKASAVRFNNSVGDLRRRKNEVRLD